MNKEKNKSKSIISIVFLIVIMAYLFLSVFSAGKYYFPKKSKRQSDKSFAKEYPLEQVSEKTAKKSVLSYVNRMESLANLFTTTENAAYNKLVEKQKYLDRYVYRYNLTTSLSGTKNDVLDSQDVVVLHDNGYLAFVTDTFDIEAPIGNVVEFSEFLENMGIDRQLYFIPTAKHESIPEEYQGVYIDYYDEMKEKVIEGVSKSHFDIISFDEVVADNAPLEKDIFYRTDHHWLTTAGITGCGIISQWLNTKGFNVDLEKYDLKNYTIKYSETDSLGSQGKKVTLAYTNTEKIPLLIPNYDSMLTVQVSNMNDVLNGRIEETLLDYSYLEKPDIYNSSRYAFYGRGSRSLINIHNNDIKDGSRILVIKESFGNCMYPYMSSMAEYVDVIDLRHFDGSLKKYIQDNKPDAVIVIYGVQGFTGYYSYDRIQNPFIFD